MSVPESTTAAAIPTAAHRPATAGGRSVAEFVWDARWTILLWALSILCWPALIVFPETLAPLARENGLIEWAGTVAFGAATVLLWVAAWRDRRRAHKVMSALLGLVFLVAFMEEISWGQQVFKWSTPTAFESNTQNETNLHNFAIGIDLQQVFTAGILFLAVVVPLLHLSAPASGWIDRVGLPVVSLGVSAWVVATVIIANVAERMMGFAAHRGLREFMETMLALAALVVAIAALRQVVRRPATQPLDTDAADGQA